MGTGTGCKLAAMNQVWAVQMQQATCKHRTVPVCISDGPMSDVDTRRSVQQVKSSGSMRPIVLRQAHLGSSQRGLQGRELDQGAALGLLLGLDEGHVGHLAMHAESFAQLLGAVLAAPPLPGCLPICRSAQVKDGVQSASSQGKCAQARACRARVLPVWAAGCGKSTIHRAWLINMHMHELSLGPAAHSRAG